MRPGGDAAGGAARPRITTAVVRSEAIRAAAAFALYLILNPVWNVARGHDAYEWLVVSLAGALVVHTQHFPIYSTLDNLKMTLLDGVVVLCAACALVSRRLAWSTRLRRFGALALALFAMHVAGFAVEAQLDAALSLEGRLAVLLPWEARIVDTVKIVLVDFGLNMGPFIVIVLGAVWNAGLALDPPPRAAPREAARERDGKPGGRTGPRMLEGRRRLPRGVLAGALVLAAAAAAWRHVRETDPRHVQAHASLGHLFLQDRQPGEAEAQYEIAVARGTQDPEAWENLANLRRQRGREGDALRLLTTSVEVVRDAAARRRLEQARVRIASGS